MWGRVVLHNTTRGNSRKIVSVDVDTNTITTEESNDDWADGDDITTQSQTNTETGYCDLDLSARIPSNARAVIFGSWVMNLGTATEQSLVWHPYSTYNGGKRYSINCTLEGDFQQVEQLIPVISQKVTFKIVSTNASMRAYCRGYIA